MTGWQVTAGCSYKGRVRHGSSQVIHGSEETSSSPLSVIWMCDCRADHARSQHRQPVRHERKGGHRHSHRHGHGAAGGRHRGGYRHKTTVEQIMSRPIMTIEEHKTLLDANDLMAQTHLRHLGVTKDGKLVGMISVRDLVVFLTNFRGSERRMAFPIQRLRRLREKETVSADGAGNELTPNDFIYPLFVTEGQGRREPIASMPGQFRLSVDLLVKEAVEVQALGIPAMILFGIPDRKDERGSSGFDPNGIVQRAIRAVKEQVPELVLITDVCIDEYTSHGHCGIVRDGRILNDETLDCLRTMARTHAQAGADMVAPSDMMDGRVAAIRDELDQAGFVEMPIMAYAAKFASCFYAPFRDAAYSSPQFGDRQSYQMDPANKREALREIDLDIEEGADIIMVKPAMPYLDIIAAARTDVTADCRLSGERGIQHDQSGGQRRLVG